MLLILLNRSSRRRNCVLRSHNTDAQVTSIRSYREPAPTAVKRRLRKPDPRINCSIQLPHVTVAASSEATRPPPLFALHSAKSKHRIALSPLFALRRLPAQLLPELRPARNLDLSGLRSDQLCLGCFRLRPECVCCGRLFVYEFFDYKEGAVEGAFGLRRSGVLSCFGVSTEVLGEERGLCWKPGRPHPIVHVPEL
jgi:hypothetical protein